MNKQEALQKIEELKAFIEQEDAKEFPQKEEEYYIVNDNREVVKRWNHNQKLTNYHLATNNVYRTSEDAKLWLEIQKRAIELRGDWKPDWSDHCESKNYIMWDYDDDEPFIESNSFIMNQGTFYMSHEAAETLIKEYGDKLKIWICGGLS